MPRPIPRQVQWYKYIPEKQKKKPGRPRTKGGARCFTIAMKVTAEEYAAFQKKLPADRNSSQFLRELTGLPIP